MHQPSSRTFSVKSDRQKKPGNAVIETSRGTLDTLIKRMLANKAFMANSGDCIDDTIEKLHTEIKQNIAVVKAQDALHKALLKFEMNRCRKTFWNTTTKLNHRTDPHKTPLQCSISAPLECLMQSEECFNEKKEEIFQIEHSIGKL